MITSDNTLTCAETGAQLDLPAQASPATDPLRPQPPEAGSVALALAKHEAFCERVTGWGGTGDPVAACEAYAITYRPRSAAAARVNASRLAARPDVKARCAWMRGQLAASVLLEKAAVRSMLYKKRMAIVEKTEGTKHKDVALLAMRDIERSLGLDGPEAQRSTVIEESGGQVAEAIEQIGRHVEAVASQFAGRRVTTVTTINE